MIIRIGVAVLGFLHLLLYANDSNCQLVINEGSNRNFNLIVDENGDSEDWIELYNAGSSAINLFGYSLSDVLADPDQWTFPNFMLDPGDYLLVFCSGKDRFYAPPFQQVVFETNYQPHAGWNIHNFTSPFYWDGISDVVVNTCSYYDQGYTENSVFYQSTPGYNCSVARFNDGNDASCSMETGDLHNRRPNIRLNGAQIGSGNIQNGNTDYPAPYGNWYWSARNQSLYRAEDLINAGLSAGPINSIEWNITSDAGIAYTYIDISLKQLTLDAMTNSFVGNDGAYFHTNFKLDSDGEQVWLFNPENEIESTLSVACSSFEWSVGAQPDGSATLNEIMAPSPGASNNDANNYVGILAPPVFSMESGVYSNIVNTSIFDVNQLEDVIIRYTLDGSEPDENSMIYNGENINVFMSLSVRARAFKNGYAPSPIATNVYLINVNHVTPIVSVIVDPNSLFGDDGIFTNWEQDWEKFAHVMYFDSTATHPLLFEKNVAMQIDGGAGGSRSNPQHSFRLELAKGALGEDPVALDLLPNRPDRAEYSRLYFRNGSNQWLTLPYKDACQVEMMCGETNTYFSAMRPVSVYINGVYFGLYEMREKLDREFYEVYDNFNGGDVDVLSLSYWYGGQLRATDGDVQHYWDTWSMVQDVPINSQFEETVNQWYDMRYYTDYIISETWMGNTDWPYNNIKIYRSDSTEQKWRFATIDMELSLMPNGWTDCNFNGLQHVLDYGEGDPYTGLWCRAIQDNSYRNYFINRYADVLNTSYRVERLVQMENNYFNRWVVEMPNEYQLWGDPWNVAGMVVDFYGRHIEFQNELICKSEVVRSQIQEIFQLPLQSEVHLNVEPIGAGSISINTITPTLLPWDGIYFQDVPISLSTDGNENYIFSHWLVNGMVVNQNIPIINNYLLGDEVNITAVYESTVEVNEQVVHNTHLVAYPNPANDLVILSNEGNRIKSVVLQSVDGKIVGAQMNVLSQTNVTFYVEGLTKGIYFATVSYLDGSSETIKILKD